MSLHNQKCTSCEKGAVPLTEKEAAKLLEDADLAGWQMLDDASLLIREIAFPNFAAAFKLVSEVSKVAEDENHHPDIAFGWGYCTIALQTHAVQGLHLNDFIMAAKISRLL